VQNIFSDQVCAETGKQRGRTVGAQAVRPLVLLLKKCAVRY
jgi:hypothetical protein